MADIALTAGNVGIVYHGEIRSFIAAAAIPGGSSVYINSSGKVDLTAGGATTTANFIGIAIPAQNSGFAAGAGQACAVLINGYVEGFTIGGLAYMAPVYVSNTAGTLGSTAGTASPGFVGRVWPMPELDGSGNIKKVLRIQSPLTIAAA